MSLPLVPGLVTQTTAWKPKPLVILAQDSCPASPSGQRSEVTLNTKMAFQLLNHTHNCSPKKSRPLQLSRASPSVGSPLKPLDLLCLCSAPSPPWATSSFLPPCHFAVSPVLHVQHLQEALSIYPMQASPCQPSKPSRSPRVTLKLSWAEMAWALWPPHKVPRLGLTAASTSRTRPDFLVGRAVVALPLEQVTHQDAQQPHEAEDRHDGNNRILGSCLLGAACPCAIPRLLCLPSATRPCCHFHTTSGSPPPL